MMCFIRFNLVLVFNPIKGVELVSATKNETGIVDQLCLIRTIQEPIVEYESHYKLTI